MLVYQRRILLVYVTRLHYNAQFRNITKYRTQLSSLYGIGKYFAVFSAPVASKQRGFSAQPSHTQVTGWIWLLPRSAIFWRYVGQQEEAVELLLLHRTELTGKCTIAIGVYCSRAVWRQGVACWWGKLNLRLAWQNIFSWPCIFSVINHTLQIKNIFLLAYSHALIYNESTIVPPWY